MAYLGAAGQALLGASFAVLSTVLIAMLQARHQHVLPVEARRIDRFPPSRSLPAREDDHDTQG